VLDRERAAQDTARIAEVSVPRLPETARRPEEGRYAALLQLQSTAGNRAVAQLIDAQGEPTAATTSTAAATADSPTRSYNLTLHGFGGTSLNIRGAPLADAVLALRRFARQLRGQVEASHYGHSYLAEVRSDQKVVAFFSDLFGGADFPPLSIWEPARAALARADAALDNVDVIAAASALKQAVDQWRSADRQLDDYREETVSGAERAIVGLQVTEVAGAIAATAATGGLAASAGVATGVLSSAGVAAATAGTYGMAQATAEQASEIHYEQRQELDVSSVLRRGATDAATTFVGAAVGGAITQRLVRSMGSFLSDASPALLAELGETAGLAGPLPRDFFVTTSQRLVAQVLGGAASAPFTVATQTAISQLWAKGAPPPTIDEFVSNVAHDVVTGAALQVLLGAMHPRTGESPPLETGPDGPVGGPRPRAQSELEPTRFPGKAANDNAEPWHRPPANENRLPVPKQAANSDVESELAEVEWRRTGTDDSPVVAAGGRGRGGRPGRPPRVLEDDDEGTVGGRPERPRPPGTTAHHPKIRPQVLRDIKDMIRRGMLRNIDEADAERWMRRFMQWLEDRHGGEGHGHHLPRGRGLTLEVFDYFDSEHQHLLNPEVPETTQWREERASRQASGRGTAVTHEGMEAGQGDGEDD
jgi:hypothetical protein